MTTVFVENCPESLSVIRIVERIGGCAIHRSLKPGENARLTLSRFKSVTVEEVPAAQAARDLSAIWTPQPASDAWGDFVLRRCG